MHYFLGGNAEEAGFSISIGSSTVLGLIFGGATIPAGSGILVTIEIEGNKENACISNPIISNERGDMIDISIINCNTLTNMN